MGTRALIKIYDECESPILTFYRQYDGYEEVCGKELKDFLTKGAIVKGYLPDEDKNNFNGMGCLAAQLVSNFKTGIGDFYIVSPTWDDNPDYEYEVSLDKDNNIIVTVVKFGKVSYKGDIQTYEISEEKE